MHRVNMKNRRTVILRTLTYGLTLFLTIITTTILLYIAQGYSLDRSSGQLVRSGLLLVDSKPVSAQAYINGELKDSSTPSRFVLEANAYELSLEQTGYRGWKKNVTLKASTVEEVYYPLLVPTDITPRSLGVLAPPQLVSQSPNRKLVLFYIPSTSQLQLTELNPKSFTSTPLTLPPTIKRENGQLGTLRVIEWALNNKQVLLEQTLPSGVHQLVSLDVTKPEEALNISTLYGTETPSDIHYVGDKTDQIYGLKDGVVSRYDLRSVKQEPLLSSVRTYRPYGSDLLFARTSADQSEVESGLWQDQKTTIISRAPMHGGIDLLAYEEYDGHHYFGVGQTTANGVVVYRDPLKKPILANQLPYVKIPVGQPQLLTFSQGSQFIVAQNGAAFGGYDFENMRPLQFTLDFVPQPESTRWMDSHHLVSTNPAGMVVMYDYDGANRQALLAVRPETPLLFADNYQHIYRVFDDSGQVNLETASMVVGKE